MPTASTSVTSATRFSPGISYVADFIDELPGLRTRIFITALDLKLFHAEPRRRGGMRKPLRSTLSLSASPRLRVKTFPLEKPRVSDFKEERAVGALQIH